MTEFTTELAKKYAAQCVAYIRAKAKSYRNQAKGRSDSPLSVAAAFFEAYADFMEGKPVTNPEHFAGAVEQVPKILRGLAEELVRKEGPGPETDDGYAEFIVAAGAIEATYGKPQS